MGGKSKPPPAPDYTPVMQGQTAVAQSSVDAANIQAQVAREQLAQQNVYAARSADVADQQLQMEKDQAAYGAQQYQDILPYLHTYMQGQSDFTQAALDNEKTQAAAAEQSRQQAADTYARYTSTYAPKEDQFANEAFAYASPARMDQAAAAARGDVATTFGAQQDAAKRQLMSYGVDPSQGAFGRTQSMNIAQAASEAAAGTLARQQTEMQGKQLELSALEVGQKLPAQAIGQATLGMNQATSGLGGAAIGGGGISAATGALNAGTNAMGSPTSYAALSNPYTSLAGSYGTSGTSLYGNQAGLFGAASGAFGSMGNTLNNMFSNQMEGYKAQAAQSPWGAIGNIAGMGLGFALR